MTENEKKFNLRPDPCFVAECPDVGCHSVLGAIVDQPGAPVGEMLLLWLRNGWTVKRKAIGYATNYLAPCSHSD